MECLVLLTDKVLFCGLSIEKGARDSIYRAINESRERLPQVRWVPYENLHITVRYFGKSDERRTGQIVERFQRLRSLLPFRIQLGGMGAFPSERSAKVIWVGVEDMEGKLEIANTMLSSGPEEIAVSTAERRFRPHITIGRVKGRPLRLANLSLAVTFADGLYKVSAFNLYESLFSGSTQEYHVICRAGIE